MAIDATLVQNLRKEQHAILLKWIEASRRAPGWLDGYGLGCSYIDRRVKGGKGYGARQRYVELDHNAAGLMPALRGIRWWEIEAVLSEERRQAVRRE